MTTLQNPRKEIVIESLPTHILWVTYFHDINLNVCCSKRKNNKNLFIKFKKHMTPLKKNKVLLNINQICGKSQIGNMKQWLKKLMSQFIKGYLHSKNETFQCQNKKTNLKIFDKFYSLLLQINTRNLRNLSEMIVYRPPIHYPIVSISRFFFHNSCLLQHDKIHMSHLEHIVD